MEEELKINESGTQVEDNTDYIAAIKELKENSVSKSDYLKLKDENKKLLNSLVNGEQISADKVEPEESIDSLKAKAFSTNASNLSIATNMIKLRERLIEDGQPDPFLPNGSKYQPEYQDLLDAESVADLMKQCIDIANGDPDVFNNEWSRHIADTPIVNKPNRR